jgi:dihydrofolate reductase
MRQVVLALGISLDGYIARLDDAVDFLFIPKDYSTRALRAFQATVDTVIMGRKTLDVAVKMTGGSYKGDVPTYVFSRTQPPGKRDGLEFVNQSPASLIRKLRKHPGKDIWMMGGGELAREFLNADLIDALHLGIVPTLIGEGIPLFPSGFPQREFKLVENRTYSKGLVALKYQRVRSKPRIGRSGARRKATPPGPEGTPSGLRSEPRR